MIMVRKNNIFRYFFQSLLIIILGSELILMPAVAAEMSMKSETNKTATMTTMNGALMQGGRAPENARDPNSHSGGYEYRGMAGWEETDEIVFSKVIIDQLEYRNNDGDAILSWDIQGWRGKDYRKIWVKIEGEDEVSSNTGEMELQTLFSRSIAAFWYFQVGARYDGAYGSNSTKDRFFAVIGFQGLAPYWFEVEPALFISEEGNVSARVVSTYDLLFSQRLILQSRFEINAAVNEAREFGVGRAINDIQLGLRLRYEIRREIAPYMGLSWISQFGDTKDIARANGENIENAAFVAGVRLWF